MTIKKNTLKYLFYSLLMIFTVPQVMAARLSTGISPLNKGIELISNLFNIEVLRTNEIVRIGFLKFAIFIVLFAVSNMALKKTKIFDKKTAGIVSLAFSMIGVFMMPIDWLNATGSLITVIMSSIIFLGFFIGLAVVAVFVLRPKGEDDPMGWVKNFLGLVLLFLLLSLLDEWADFVRLPVMFLMSKGLIQNLFKYKYKTKGKNKWQ